MFGSFSKVLDPVCRMKMDKDKSKFFLEHEGKRYYFCSEDCKNKFDTNPKQYIAKEESVTGGCCQSKS